MSAAAFSDPVLINTFIDGLALLFLTAADGDFGAARAAAGRMLSVYRPRDEEELAFASEIITLTMQSIRAGGEAADPTLPAARVARLRSEAVRCSREAHRNRSALAQYRRDHAAAQARQAAEAVNPAPQAEVSDPVPPAEASPLPPASPTASPAGSAPATSPKSPVWNAAMVGQLLAELARDGDVADLECLVGAGLSAPSAAPPPEAVSAGA